MTTPSSQEGVTKVEEREGDSTRTASILAVSDTVAPPEFTDTGKQNQLYAAVTAKGKPYLHCSHCDRSGHTIDRCFVRQRDLKKVRTSRLRKQLVTLPLLQICLVC